ncbi:MAG: phosphoenolpyruvate--protein phosphotransferase [Desulfuromonas sp.]|nr:MAG: phosphoenolpyruvate--protein phosphotransferase [Desulfuromonas sp.]
MTVSAKSSIPEDTYLVGIGVSPGIAIGTSFLVNRERVCVVERSIDIGEVPDEIDHFQRALEMSREQLQAVRNGVRSDQLGEHLYIIDTHLMILSDQMLIDGTIEQIREHRLSAEAALKRILQQFRATFDAIEDEYLRDRGSDIDAVGERILRNLTGMAVHSLDDIERPSIIIAHDLSPADTLQMDRERVCGFVTDVGGRTSHTAILARSLGIPAVVGLETITRQVPENLTLVIDGNLGTVILNPSDETIREYRERLSVYQQHEQALAELRDLPAVTLDGVHISLKGNVELPEDAQTLLEHGGDGVGLFRSEFLYMRRAAPPGEDEQMLAYKNVLATMAPKPVTIRTLDLGGDKFVREIDLSDEANPALGLRGVRFSLKEIQLFKIQLRAILRSATAGSARIMFPMITGVGELRLCKELLAEVSAELCQQGIEHAVDIPIGIMIETPSSALIPDLLAREVDFFSVGTNDLIQYCLAVDRGNEHVADLYNPLHPAILRALKRVCNAAHAAGIEVGMCGEMASEPLYAMVLAGLGFHDLSMNAFCIPRVKRVMRQIHVSEGVELVEQLLQMPLAVNISHLIEKKMQERFPELFGVTI